MWHIGVLVRGARKKGGETLVPSSKSGKSREESRFTMSGPEGTRADMAELSTGKGRLTVGGGGTERKH